MMTGAPFSSPHTRRPLWAKAVEHGKPGISPYAIAVAAVRFSASSPIPVPRITAAFASQDQLRRMKLAAAATRSALVAHWFIERLRLLFREHAENELCQIRLRRVRDGDNLGHVSRLQCIGQTHVGDDREADGFEPGVD